MNELCPTHGSPFELKEGVSKTTGKPYSFVGCSIRDQNGWCKQKPTPPDTAPKRFEQSLDTDIARSRADAADDRKRLNIYRSVSLQQAVAFYAGKQTTREAVVDTAQTFYSWLSKE